MSKRKNGNKNKLSNSINKDQMGALKSLREDLVIQEKEQKREEKKVVLNDVNNPDFIYKECNKDFIIPIEVYSLETTKKSNQEINSIKNRKKLGNHTKVETKNILKEFTEYQINKITVLIDKLIEQRLYVEMIITDIRHIIENENFNAAQGYDLAKAMQIALRHRRDIKDDIERLEKLRSLLITETISLIDINKSLMTLEKTQMTDRNNMESYTFRILTGADMKVRHIRSMVSEILNKGDDPKNV